MSRSSSASICLLLALAVLVPSSPQAAAGTCLNGWQSETFPASSLPTDDGYYDVTIPSPTTGWLLGKGEDAAGSQPELMQRVSGSWSEVSAPMSGDTAWYEAADSLSTGETWLVGRGGTNSPPYQRFILTANWDGVAWSTDTITFAGYPEFSPKAVEMVATDDVWMTGEVWTDGETSGVFAKRWDGLGWADVAVPSASNPVAATSIAALNGSDAWIVGSSFSGSRSRTYIMHWDGLAWSRAPSPNSKATTNRLLDIAVVSADDAWAVGYRGSPNRTFTLHWDGASWKKVASPNPGDKWNYLNAVATAGGETLAVGAARTTGKGLAALILRWNGTAWRQVIPPKQGSWEFLNDVAADPSGAFVAVGSGGPTGNIVLATC